MEVIRRISPDKLKSPDGYPVATPAPGAEEAASSRRRFSASNGNGFAPRPAAVIETNPPAVTTKGIMPADDAGLRIEAEHFATRCREQIAAIENHVYKTIASEFLRPHFRAGGRVKASTDPLMPRKMNSTEP